MGSRSGVLPVRGVVTDEGALGVILMDNGARMLKI